MARVEDLFAVEAFGVALDVEVAQGCGGPDCPRPGLVADVAALLPPGSRPRPAGRGPTVVFRVECTADGLRLVEDGLPVDTSEGEPLHLLDGAIRSVVAQAAPGLVFVHAGVVGVDDQAIVLPGRSMAGKTTLVAALVAAGATYLSDEYAVLDAEGLVHPYPRRLSIRGPQRREVPVADLGGTTATSPVPVALVAAVRYRPGSWTARSGEASACALALIDNAIAARSRSGEVLSVAATVARRARFVEAERGDAEDAVPELLALVRR